MARAGALFKQRGQPSPTEADAEMLADDYAQSYGATRTRGQWGRATHVKFLWENGERKPDLWRCPDCAHEWAYGTIYPPRAASGIEAQSGETTEELARSEGREPGPQGDARTPAPTIEKEG